jgi:hypothetical protein
MCRRAKSLGSDRIILTPQSRISRENTRRDDLQHPHRLNLILEGFFSEKKAKNTKKRYPAKSRMSSKAVQQRKLRFYPRGQVTGRTIFDFKQRAPRSCQRRSDDCRSTRDRFSIKKGVRTHAAKRRSVVRSPQRFTAVDPLAFAGPLPSERQVVESLERTQIDVSRSNFGGPALPSYQLTTI